MIAIAIVTSIIHPPHGPDYLTWTLTRFIFAILCFKDLRNINPIKFAKVASWLSPLIVFPHYVITNPFSYGEYRYSGFYGDPNFLSLALNLIIILCFIASVKSKNTLLKFFCITSIIGSVPLILLGMSRGGVLGLIVILAFIMTSIWKKSKKISILLILTLIGYSGTFIAKFDTTLTMIENRFSGDSTQDVNGAKARVEGIESVINVMSNCPELIPVGIGLGNTAANISTYRPYGYYCKYVVHNTFFSLFYEAGIVMLILYISIYIYILKRLWRYKNYLLIGLLLSGTLSLMTLPGVCFMPAWIMLFFLANKQIQETSISQQSNSLQNN